jgi:hypothetical protein
VKKPGALFWLIPVLLLPFSAQAATALDRLSAKICEPLEKLAAEKGQPLSLALLLAAEPGALGQASRLLQELEGLLRYRLEESNWVEQLLPVSPVAGASTLERARAAGAGWLLRIVVGLQRGRLVANVELSPLPAGFWTRLAGQIPHSLAAQYLVVEQEDAAVMMLSEQKRLEKFSGSWSLSLLGRLQKRYLALAAGDVDGDGAEEVVLLAREGLEVYRLQGAALKKLAEYGFSQIPQQSTVSRESLGRVVAVDINHDERAEVFYGTNWLRQGEVLAFSGAVFFPLRRLSSVPLCLVQRERRWQVVLGSLEPGTNVFSRSLVLHDINASGGEEFLLPAAFLQLSCMEEGGRWRWVESPGVLAEAAPEGRRVLFEDCGLGALLLGRNEAGEELWLLSGAVYPGRQDRLRLMLGGREIWSSSDFQGAVVDSTLSTDPAGGGKRALVLAVDEKLSSSYLYLLSGEGNAH